MRNLFLGILVVVFLAGCSNPFFPPLKDKGELDDCLHVYSNWTTKTEATCVAKEVQERTCSLCGDKQIKEVGELGHVPGEAATCTTDQICTICEEVLVEAGHTLGAEATCTDDQVCMVCHVVIAEALGHVPGSIATCTEAQTCTVCNDVIEEAPGHAFSTIPATCITASIPGSCTRDDCNEANPESIVLALKHNWNWSSYLSGSGLRECQRNDCTVKAGIGDTGPAGGIIFYSTEFDFFTGTTVGDNNTVKRYYLETALVNEPSNPEWGAYGTLISGVTIFTSSDASVASIIGNGRKDTNIIANHLKNNTTETNRAAQLCVNKNFDGFSDWFLPSLGELNQLYHNRDTVNNAGGNLGAFWGYWSSSQYNNNLAWYMIFYNDEQLFTSKYVNISVRAIRAF